MSVSVAKSAKAETNKNIMTGVLRGSLFAVAVSLVAILLFAVIIKITSISDNLIDPVNQAIKGISILMGCFNAFKSSSTNGLIKGILIGIVYVVMSFLIFSILNGQFSFGKNIINDLLFGGIIGAICGVIAINFKK